MRSLVLVLSIAACGQAATADPVAVVAAPRAPAFHAVPALPVVAPAVELAVADGDDPTDDADEGPDVDVDDIPDVDDRCPDEPENIDGFDDSDGCPETAPAS
jgi:hypothetical protein